MGRKGPGETIMKVITIDCFELLVPDGGGISENRVGLVATEELAKQWVSQASGWPRYHRRLSERIVVFDSLQELEENSIEKRRAKALAKLDADDIKVLGINIS